MHEIIAYKINRISISWNYTCARWMPPLRKINTEKMYIGSEVERSRAVCEQGSDERMAQKSKKRSHETHTAFWSHITHTHTHTDSSIFFYPNIFRSQDIERNYSILRLLWLLNRKIQIKLIDTFDHDSGANTDIADEIFSFNHLDSISERIEELK